MSTKRKPDERLQRLLKQHIEAFSQAVTDLVSQDTPPDAKLGTTIAAHYAPSTRRWFCPKCKRFEDSSRRAVTTHMRTCS